MTRSWANSLMQKKGFGRRAATTQAKRQVTRVEVQQMEALSLCQISHVVFAHKIPSQLVIN